MKEVIKRFQKQNLYISNYGKAFKWIDGGLTEADTVKNGNKKAINLEDRKRMNIDSLVWVTFGGETGGRERLHIKHIDGDPDNNRLDNLELPQLKIRKVMPDEKYEELQKRIAELETELKAAKYSYKGE